MNQSVLVLTSGLIFFLINLQQTLESGVMSGCVCPGDTLTYECIVVRGVGTVWTGTAFNCSGSNNEILLFHSHFSSTEGDYGLCNNGAIVGRNLGVEGNNYTSQLNVTVTPDIAGKTVECFYDDGYTATLLFTLMIPTTGPFSPPNRLTFSKIDYASRELTFSWSPVAPECPAIHYNILASNCGSCPSITNHTTITCMDVPANNTACTFAIQTVVCGNITGDISYPISIVLYATEPTTKTPTGTIYLTDNQNTYTSETVGMHNSAIDTVYIITFSSATALIVCVVVTIVMVVVVLKRRKAKTTAVFVQSNRAEGTEHDEPMYENITGPLPSVSAITTQDNVAYGYIKTFTTAI